MNLFGRDVRHVDQYQLYLFIRAVSAFAFALIITYELVYHTVEIGLTPLQLVTVGVVLESMTLLFEVPTGVVADAYSRRLSMLIGLFLVGIGFLVEGVVATFTAVLITQVIWGIGFTFYSGAAPAWVTDEIGEEKASQALLRGTQVAQVMGFMGVAAGALLVGGGLRRPILIGSLLYFLLGAVAAWYMTEEGFQPAPQLTSQTILDKMRTPLRDGLQLVRQRFMLLLILLTSVVIGLYAGGFDRLNAAHFTGNFTLPSLGVFELVAWFSIFRGIAVAASLIGTEIVRRRLNVNNNVLVAKVLFWLYGGMIICTMAFALTQWFVVAVICYCLSQSFRNTGRPLLIIWINQNTVSQVRATVISLSWQANALGQILGSPIIGWIGSAFSVRAALVAGTAVYTAVLPLLKFASRHAETELAQPTHSKDNDSKE
ncbi:MAG: MFS transporter [Chloroflexota bacterium]